MPTIPSVPSSVVPAYELSGSSPSLAGYPGPSDLPATLPTAASAMAYFEALYGRDDSNMYGLEDCFGRDCELSVAAGHVRRDSPMGQPGAPAPERSEERRVGKE